MPGDFCNSGHPRKVLQISPFHIHDKKFKSLCTPFDIYPSPPHPPLFLMIDTFRNMLLFQLTMDQCFAFSLCVVERLEAEGKVFNKGDVEGQGKIFGD